MLAGFLDLFHGIFSFFRVFHFCSCHCHNLDTREIRLEANVEGETIGLGDLTTFGIFEEDFEFSAS